MSTQLRLCASTIAPSSPTWMLYTLCQSRVPALGKLASIVYAYPYKPAFTIPPLGCPVIQPRSIPVVTLYFLNNLNIYSIILYKITWGFSGEVGELANYGYPHLSVHLLACQWEEKVAVVWTCNISSIVCVLSAWGEGVADQHTEQWNKPKPLHLGIVQQSGLWPPKQQQLKQAWQETPPQWTK